MCSLFFFLTSKAEILRRVGVDESRHVIVLRTVLRLLSPQHWRYFAHAVSYFAHETYFAHVFYFCYFHLNRLSASFPNLMKQDATP